MAYTKTNWVNGTTPINETNLNKIEDGLASIGKQLWTGTLNTANPSITVDGISNYTLLAMNVGGVWCIGTINYGGAIIGSYGSYSSATFNYRLDANGNTLTIDNNNRGGSDGTQNVAITKIVGIF